MIDYFCTCWLTLRSELLKANGVNSVPIYLNDGNEIQF